MTGIEQLAEDVGRLTTVWLDAICYGSASDAGAAADAVHRAEDALCAERRSLRLTPLAKIAAGAE